MNAALPILPTNKNARTLEPAKVLRAHEFRAVRKELGLLQAETAELLGLGKSGRITISMWENGRNPIPGAASLALTLLLQRERGSFRQHEVSRRKA